jgi:hypothetical protein
MKFIFYYYSTHLTWKRSGAKKKFKYHKKKIFKYLSIYVFNLMMKSVRKKEREREREKVNVITIATAATIVTKRTDEENGTE